MPCIVMYTNMEVPKEKAEELKKALVVSWEKLPGKSERWLITTIRDNTTMFFGGKDSYTVTLGHTNTLTIGSEAWLKVVNGSHTLKIVATDAKDASVTRTLTFTKAVTSVEFEQTLAMEADAMPTKALVNIQGNFPAGCTLQVWICNNGNDASPTWEDITQKVRAGQKHYFTNKTKTAAAWGVKVKAKLLRGSATETCYIQSIGGNFA